MPFSTCGICAKENLDEIEAEGLEALQGRASWSGTARKLGLHPTSLKVHMTKHFAAPLKRSDEAMLGYDDVIAQSVSELQDAMKIAPPEVKALYAVAIQNLLGIRDTKPSQDMLVKSIKAIHEVTGMRMEQRMMLEFARAAFAGEIEEPKQPIEAQLVTYGELMDGDN